MMAMRTAILGAAKAIKNADAIAITAGIDTAVRMM
jgi:hypothetical protein